MKLSHKKVFEYIAHKYNLTYQKWSGWMTPKNYTTFTDNKNHTVMDIEMIPAWKYLKTLYIMLQWPTAHFHTDICNDIEKQYTSQREWQPVEWCIDYNVKRNWLVF